jgi:hypothetical protein
MNRGLHDTFDPASRLVERVTAIERVWAREGAD